MPVRGAQLTDSGHSAAGTQQPGTAQRPRSTAPPQVQVRTRSSRLPWNLTALMTGHQRRNSFSQLCSVDLGTMTWGGEARKVGGRGG